MALLKNIIFACLFFHSCTSTAFDKYRLPKLVKPIHYKIYLQVNPEETHFFGNVEIKLDVQNTTSNVLFLNADHNYIAINSINLNGTACNCSLFNDVATQIFPIKCPTDFKSEQNLSISFKGKFSNDMSGFYKSMYDNKTLVATQFQPNFARRAFPCFDEPSFKATFEITIVNPKNYKVLANTPLKEVTHTRHSVTSKFQTSPRMSTYLVAIIISKFKPAIDNEQDFNVFARPSAAQNMRVASEYGEQLYDYMGQITKINYEDMGNPQQFLIGIPDFAAGAMENWGLINFRELSLLDDGTRTSNAAFQTIIMVMSHEIAHQWFGNYVTLDWWSNTWLNEGAAEYFGMLITDMVNNGTLEFEKQFVIDSVQRILQKDAMDYSTPLSTPEDAVKTSLEINNNFNELTYFKGACIFRMINYILGWDTFRKGINHYLLENKYGNVNPKKLLSSLQIAAGHSVDKFEEKMYNWIYQPGFPLLTVLQKNISTVAIIQEKFCVSESCNSTTQWYVPLSYTSGTFKNLSANVKHWLEPNHVFEIEHDHNDWFLLNIQEIGYFRVNYAEKLWDNLIKALNNDKVKESIDPVNRAQLIDDIFQIAKIGKISYDKAFSLAQYLQNETSYYPWASAIKSFLYLLDNIDADTGNSLREWLLRLLIKAFPSNTNYSSHVDKLKETLITEVTCKLGHKDCLLQAREQFIAFKEKKLLVDPNKEYLVYCYGLMESDNIKEDFEFLLDVFKKSSSAHEKFVILTAIGCMQDVELLTNYLDLTIIQNSPIREQDFATVFNSVYFNSKMGVGMALDFMEKKFKNMEIAYGGTTVLSLLMVDLAEKISSKDEINKIKNIIATNQESEQIKLAGPAVMEIINANQQWKMRYENKIKAILIKQNNIGIKFSSNISITFLSLVIFHIYL